MDFGKVINSLTSKGYTTAFFENSKQAVAYLEENIKDKTVGFGDSKTLSGLGLYEKLKINNSVLDPQNCLNNNEFIECAKKCLTTNIFITSVNALSEDGCIVNIDGTGNRIAGSLFGHEKVFFIIGINKIAPTLEKAIWRARNVAAPQNAKRLNLKTPCAVNGDRCYNCKSPERICNAMVVHWNKMNDIDMEVILVNENLGY